MKITQKKIAEAVGVSQCVVSYVLRGVNYHKVKPEVVNKILSTAAIMGYKQKFVPAEKFIRATRNIGYLIPLPIKTFLNDSYYTRFGSGLSTQAEKENFNLIIYSNYLYLIKSIINNNLCGAVIETPITDEEAITLKRQIPMVFLNWRSDNLAIDSVMPDNKGGIKKAVLKLFSLGHRRIALFGMEPLSLHSKERFEGYCIGLEECGLKQKPEYIFLPEVKKRTHEEIAQFAKDALQKWMSLPEKPTAIVTIGDIYALTILRMAQKLGIKIPYELSLIGFDNRDFCAYSNPSLTSIEQPMEEMAKKAIILLKERIDNPGKHVEHITFNVEIVERESICEPISVAV